MPPTMEFSLPIFQSNQFSYVPWRPATNDTTFQLHYHSLTVLPPLSFDNKTLNDLDTLYSQLDGQLTAPLRDVHHNIKKLKPDHTSTLNDVLTYLALSLTLLHSVLFIAFFLFSSMLLFAHCTTWVYPYGLCSHSLQRHVRCSHS